MAKHSISEAARLTGKSRSTLHRHLKQGKLSKEIGPEGEPVIDTSELARVYGTLSHQGVLPASTKQQPGTPSDDAATKAEMEALRRENETLREERDRWATQAERLTLLLSDQRPPQGRSQGLLARFLGRR